LRWKPAETLDFPAFPDQLTLNTINPQPNENIGCGALELAYLIESSNGKVAEIGELLNE
jgi:hypothetical protein